MKAQTKYDKADDNEFKSENAKAVVDESNQSSGTSRFSRKF